MRAPSVEDVFALGDCAGFLEQTGKPVLPALAQVKSYTENGIDIGESENDKMMALIYLYVCLNLSKQVAERQGKYLAELFNKKIGEQDGGKALSAKDINLGDQFVYKHLGSMATVGRYKALVDLRQSKVKSQAQLLRN